MRSRGIVVAALGLAAALATASCSPPGSDSVDNQPQGKPVGKIQTDPSKAGNITLNVWDQEVRGGQNAQLQRLNDEFHQRYPNITINRTAKSTDDLKTTLKLALSGNNPPDVVEANQGYPDMVAFVKAGLLTPLDNYATAHGWRQRYPESLLKLNSVSPDAKSFGTGKLYGLSQMGEYIGLFYNKRTLARAGIEPPRTWQQFTTALGKLKSARALPIQFGNLDREAAIHLFGVLGDQIAGRDTMRALVYGTGTAKWTDPKVVDAARTLQDWARDGWLTRNGNGLSYDDAAKQFAAGKGAFMVTGTWETAVLAEPMGNNLGIMPPPPARPGGPRMTTGGQSLALAISSKSEHPDAAAAYLDFLTDKHASQVMADTGNLPAVPGNSGARLQSGSAARAMLDGWKKINAGGGPSPYPDYTTPSFYDTITAALQELVGGKITPRQFANRLQADVDKFQQGR